MVYKLTNPLSIDSRGFEVEYKTTYKNELCTIFPLENRGYSHVALFIKDGHRMLVNLKEVTLAEDNKEFIEELINE